MCLPYFFRKTRPRASYELLEAFLPSLAADRASRWSRGGIPRAHLGAWKPESRSIHHTRAGNPNSGWVSTGRLFAPIRHRQSQSGLPHLVPAHLHPAGPTCRPTHPHPSTHTRAPTPTRPHPRAHTQRKKNLKKNLTPFFFAPIVHP